MIFVILGTQDKEFTRLLDAVEHEIKNGNIKERVVVQAGQTKYQSENMEIFDLLPSPEFNKLMDEADLIITHGGAGSILTAIKKGKKVIAAARLEKYKEHHNDHQKQIIGEFAKLGYILELRDFNKLGVMIKKSKTFKPKKFESNTNNMIKLIENYIEDSNHTAWYHKYQELINYIIVGGLTTVVSLVTKWSMWFTICDPSVNTYFNQQLPVDVSWVVAVIFAYVTNRLFVFRSKNKSIFKEFVSFVGSRVLTFIMEKGLTYLFLTVLAFNTGSLVIIQTLIIQVLVTVLNYVFSKLFVFKK